MLLFSCAQNETRSLSNELDRMLERKEEFEMEKENRIARLREWLNVPGISPEQEYEINAGLCEEFSKYRSDSAIRYVKRNLSLAQRMNDRPKYLASELQLARLYSFLGRSVEANRLLRSIRAEELPSDLLPVYYRAWSNYYQHYASLSNQSGYLQEREAYRDSLLMTADPESFRYKLSRSYVLMQDGRLDEAQAAASLRVANLLYHFRRDGLSGGQNLAYQFVAGAPVAELEVEPDEDDSHGQDANQNGAHQSHRADKPVSLFFQPFHALLQTFDFLLGLFQLLALLCVGSQRVASRAEFHGHGVSGIGRAQGCAHGQHEAGGEQEDDSFHMRMSF